MNSLAQHLMLRLVDDRVIAPSLFSRRRLARCVLKLGRKAILLAFRLVDTHLHVLVKCDRRTAGELARRLEIALRQQLELPVPFATAHIKPVRDQRHLRHLFAYIFRQEEHHGVHVDPRFEASNLPDLLGLRTVGSYTLDNVREHLPRIKLDDLAAERGLRLRAEYQLDELPNAAAAAMAIPGHPRRWSRLAVAARRAAVHVAGSALATPRLARMLGVSERTVRRLRSEPVPAELVRAVELQLRLTHNNRAAPAVSPAAAPLEDGRRAARAARSGIGLAG